MPTISERAIAITPRQRRDKKILRFPRKKRVPRVVDKDARRTPEQVAKILSRGAGTELHLHCAHCGHSAHVTVPRGRVWKFRCSQCDTRI
jgi:hypothetical protein